MLEKLLTTGISNPLAVHGHVFWINDCLCLNYADLSILLWNVLCANCFVTALMASKFKICMYNWELDGTIQYEVHCGVC